MMASARKTHPGSMKGLLVACAVALLFAAIITQIATTIFSGHALSVLVLSFVGCLLTAWIVVRNDRRAAAEARSPKRARRSQPTAAGKRETGSIKWFDHNRGYGFIVRANGDEIFVHQRSVRRTSSRHGNLRDGQTVSFVAVKRQRGWQAEDVELVNA